MAETEVVDVDPMDGWTAQQPSPVTEVDPALEPVQYLPEQLPDPAAAEMAGVPVLKIPQAQQSEKAVEHPNGPEPGEVLIAEGRRAAGVGTSALEPLNEEAEDGGGEVDLEAMTKAEIQAWADANGYEGTVDKDTMSKAEMIDAILGG